MRKTLSLLLLAASLLCGVPIHAARHEYHTITTPLTDKMGGNARGTVKIICNGGQDADCLRVHASGLKPETTYRLFYVEPGTRKRAPLGDPPEVKTDARGVFQLVMYGKLCPIDKYGLLVVIEEGVTIMTADITVPE
ncbi:MAG: DUF4102 domain-containing protein [Armatimonadetes bacterium]|nr:DUF4102 domain-containing protein [Armatimonadota bacterium]